MKRRIIELGHNSHVITLPSKWIKEKNLKKSDEISLEYQEDNILIYAKEGVKKTKEISIKIPNKRESAIRTILANLYRAGYDKIHIEFEGNKTILSKIISTTLLGFELFSRKDKTYVIESVSEPSYENFENIIIKQTQIISEILKNLEIEDTTAQVEVVQKYDNFLKRCISKNIIEIKNKMFLWQFLSHLTQIARLCHHWKKSFKQLSDHERKNLIHIQAMFSLLQKAYLKKDIEILSQLHDEDQKSMEDMKKIIEKSGLNGYYLVSISRQIYLANSPLTGIIIN